MGSLTRPIAFAAALITGITVHSQIAFGGRAFGLMERGPELPAPMVHRLPAVDAAAMIAEDEARIAQGIKGPYRFGFNHHVNIMMDAGTWTDLPNGDRIWRLALECPEAFSIGLVFSEFVVPHGGLVFLYNNAGEQRGAYMAGSGGGTVLATDHLSGERITIEYFEPAAVLGEGSLAIGRVTHAYRDVLKLQRDLGDSGACNINVICPQGDEWRDQIRAVALIDAGGGYCTGTLLNNCANDTTPYFLTADHCLGTDVSTWVFRFNWDSPVCDPTENGPMNMTVSGASLLVNSGGTDVALLELSSRPPDDYNVFYSGWDKSATPADSVTGIHHPAGDIKKISRSFNPVVAGQMPSAETWNVLVWDEGTTEPGSSGSGLWNQDGRLVGQLFGGQAACGNSIDDHYGRFDISWPLLEPYLGSCGDTLDGLLSDQIPDIFVDAACTSITNVPELICGDTTITPHVTLKNNGDEVITTMIVNYGLEGGIPLLETWNGSLMPGQTVNFQLPELVVPPGEHTLVIATNSPNGEQDQMEENDAWTHEFTVNYPVEDVVLELVLDDYGTDITWELTSEDTTLLYEGGPYANGLNGDTLIIPLCLSNGCYTFNIYDEFGDGICCGPDQDGSYSIHNGDGHIFAINDGNYGDGNTDVFCLIGVSIEEMDLSDRIEVFPNPANGTLNLRSEAAIDRFSLLDGLGRQIITRELSGADRLVQIELAGVAEGVYLLEVSAEGQRAVKRVVVQR